MRRSPYMVLPALGLWAATSAVAQAQGWVNFQNETGTRLVAAANLGSADPEEKDFAWGDLDQDGDVDLVVVRKQPFTTFGVKRNVLFMNESGVLVDRTTELGSAANDGGQGLLDLTNDRDVSVADINNDGWLDVVTVPALSQSLPKKLSHPRIYLNKGDDGGGNWLGLMYDEPRIPQMVQAPNACGLAVGDVTGDGWADLYIVDYNSSLEDRLLVNQGNGFFVDQTTMRMTSQMVESGFGTSAVIADANGDGVNDVVKNEAGTVDLNQNNAANVGFFNKFKNASGGSHYHTNAGDLNNDGKLDIIVSDDGLDRYLLNTGNAGDGTPTFLSKTYAFQSGGDDGIGGNNHIADLNNDGWNDVLIADVDVDIPGCGRRLHLYRNLGNAPTVTLQDQGTGGIPTNMLTGTFDVAPMDVNGDGWLDLVIGRCAGIQVWIQQPPVGLTFGYPGGLPGTVAPGEATTFHVALTPIGATSVIAGSEKLFTSIDGAAFTSQPLVPTGGGQYDATLPAAPCTSTIAFYVSAQLVGGGTFKDPPSAPAAPYTAESNLGTRIAFQDTIEADVSGWSTSAAPGLTGGAWQAVDPVGTASGGHLAAPEEDATSGDGVKAWITQNGLPGQPAGASDVDGGPAYLVSPEFDLAGNDSMITYSRWMFCDDDNLVGADFLVVEVTNDGGATWTQVESLGSTANVWENHTFRVSDFVVPTANVRLRFSVADIGNNSITEAGVDNLVVEEILCGSPCPADLDGSGSVDGADIGVLLAAWGGGGAGDLDGSGTVDGGDIGLLLASWGGCP